MIIMILSAAYLGLKNKNKELTQKNKVIMWAAILIDGFELFKILIFSLRGKDPMAFIYELPLF